MRRRIQTAMVLFLGLSTTYAAEPSKKEVKRLAEKVAKATIEGDAETIVDLSYPGLVKLIGGRKEMIEFTRAAIEQLRDEGDAFKKFEVKEPQTFYTEGANTFIVVPTRFEMMVSKKTVAGESYLLAISSDQGKTWTFLDGSGMHHKEFRKKILPKLPEKLILPELSKPMVIEDEPSD